MFHTLSMLLKTVYIKCLAGMLGSSYDIYVTKLRIGLKTFRLIVLLHSSSYKKIKKESDALLFILKYVLT